MDNNTFEERYTSAPNVFKRWMAGKLDFSETTILDLGCDTAVMTLGLMHHCSPKRIIGVDINDNYKNLLNEASRHLNISALPQNLEFYRIKPNENISAFLSDKAQIDCVFSWSVFEHISQPILTQMASELYLTLRPGGFAFIQIAPLYYSAFGSHLDTIIPQPWAHLESQHNLFKDQIFSTGKHGAYANEEDENFKKIKTALWSTYSTLNKITADELIDLFKSVGFKLLKQYRPKSPRKPPKRLTAIYKRKLLTTEQVVALFIKT